MKKRIAILGSTGSIGTQTLDVIDANPELFSVEVLTANDNADLLIQQAKKYQPNMVVIANEQKYQLVTDALKNDDIKVFAGANALTQVVQIDSVDTVVASMVGYAGLLPVISAIKAKKQIALANKETLVVAGDIITELCREYNVPIFPVDSEHSAIFQCLSGEAGNPIEKIFLTCSGGPFRNFTYQQLEKATPRQALAHPNWDMGAKITIDSATLMNKGFEVIEAKWLFDLHATQIDVVIHPQSIIHSMVQFTDGSIKAQMGLPNMRIPIQFALSYPDRFANNFERFDFLKYPELTFSSPNSKNFRNLAIAFSALEKGGNAACTINAANEVMVKAFLQEKVGFFEMSDIIEEVLEKVSFIKKPTISDYIETDRISRIYAEEMVASKVEFQ